MLWSFSDLTALMICISIFTVLSPFYPPSQIRAGVYLFPEENLVSLFILVFRSFFLVGLAPKGARQIARIAGVYLPIKLFTGSSYRFLI